MGNPFHPATGKSLIDLYNETHRDDYVRPPAPRVLTSPDLYKIEVGCGPTPRMTGEKWLYNDVTKFESVTLNCKASEINLPDKSCDFIYMFGVFEHFDYREAQKAIENFARLLIPGGVLQIMDIPDAFSYVDVFLENLKAGNSFGKPGFNPEYDPPIYNRMDALHAWAIRATYGWQRWPGDEHKTLWNQELLLLVLQVYFEVTITVERITTFIINDKAALHYHVTAVRRA
jgi:predicted SAM-dependent methyltransferase